MLFRSVAREEQAGRRALARTGERRILADRSILPSRIFQHNFADPL
ncbi:MAG: hypothetical protein SGJ19_20000 [Planctomycetia bacterium]|nr:hypothetical protein [Planctomycetia bacterium]